MATNETAVAEVGNSAMDVTVGRLSELPAFDPSDPAMVFMAQLAHRWRMANMLARSGMVPQKTPEAIIAIMLKGHELGVPPMVACANMFFFDGKLGMSADLMTSLFIQRAGGKLDVLEWSRDVCRIRFSRQGWEPSVVEYTTEDAKEAGLLGKQNWRNRKAMLSARCRSMGVRLLAPDVFAGTYSSEELADIREEQTAAAKNSASALAERLNAAAIALPEPSAPAQLSGPRLEVGTTAPPAPVQMAESAPQEDDAGWAREAETQVAQAPAGEQQGEPEPDYYRELLGATERLMPEGGPRLAGAAYRTRLRNLADEVFGAGTEEALMLRGAADHPELSQDQVEHLVNLAKKAKASPASASSAEGGLGL